MKFEPNLEILIAMKLKTTFKKKKKKKIYITEQVNESKISIKESIIDALKEENKLFRSRVLKLEHITK